MAETARRTRAAFLNRHVRTDSAGEVFRVGSLIGLVGAAGEIATAYGITGWKKGDAMRAAETIIRQWIDRRGGTGAHDLDGGVNAVRAFLEEHGSSRFQDLRGSDRPVFNRAGFKEKEKGGHNDDDNGSHIYYFHETVFREQACKGYDYKPIARELIRRGFMRYHGGRNLKILKAVPELGRTRFFAILPAIFAGAQNDEEPCRGISRVPAGGYSSKGRAWGAANGPARWEEPLRSKGPRRTHRKGKTP